MLIFLFTYCQHKFCFSVLSEFSLRHGIAHTNSGLASYHRQITHTQRIQSSRKTLWRRLSHVLRTFRHCQRKVTKL